MLKNKSFLEINGIFRYGSSADLPTSLSGLTSLDGCAPTDIHR